MQENTGPSRRLPLRGCQRAADSMATGVLGSASTGTRTSQRYASTYKENSAGMSLDTLLGDLRDEQACTDNQQRQLFHENTSFKHPSIVSEAVDTWRTCKACHTSSMLRVRAQRDRSQCPP